MMGLLSVASQPTTRPKSSALLQLPTEVIVKVLALLDIKELIASQSACRRLHAIISESLLLQYHIRLAASGMRDGSPSDQHNTAERLTALEAYNEARRDLAWSAYDTIDVPAACWMPQFSDGVVAFPSRDMRSLTVHRLPSKLRRVEARHWTLAFDFAIAHFALDASQDLLALVPAHPAPSPSQWCEPRILLRTLSNGQPHPLANPTVLELQNTLQQPTMDPDTTVIRDSHLGTIVVVPGDGEGEGEGGGAPQLMIWNWKTGRREWCMPIGTKQGNDGDGNGSGNGIAQWCFLDDAHVVFPKTAAAVSSDSLELDAFHRATRHRHHRSRRLHVCRFRGGGSADDDGVVERVFELPGPRCARRSSMGARFLSRPRSSLTPTSSSSSTTDALFHPSGQDDLLSVELWSYSPSGWEVSELHIPPHVLVHQHQRIPPPSKNKNNNSIVVIPWEAWNARIIAHFPPHAHNRPRDLAPLGPLSHAMRRLAWDCGIQSSSSSSYYGDISRGVIHSWSQMAPQSRRKTISVYDLHPGRVALTLGTSAGAGDGGAWQQPPCCIISEAPLPREIQEADPIGLKFVMCEDALVIFELLEQEVNRLHVLSF